jgi:tetratricopeptide (TPR) repeat protein
MLRRFASLYSASAIDPVDLDTFVTHWRARGLEWPVLPTIAKGRLHAVTFSKQPTWATLIGKLSKFCTCPAQLTALGSAAPLDLRDSALKCYVKALRADEKHVEAWKLLGKLLGAAHSTAIVRGTPVTHRECLYRALKCDPSQAELWAEVGLNLHGDGRVTIGTEQNLTKKDCFVRALERGALGPDWLVGAWRHLGECLSAGESVRVNNEDVDAVGCFKKVLCLDKTLPLSWSNLAELLTAAGRTVDIDGTSYNQRDLIVKALSLSRGLYSQLGASDDYCLLAELLGKNVTVYINGTEVNQQLCWIRALEHDWTRWEAWLRLGRDLARSGSDSQAIIDGKTYSAVECFARAVAVNKKCREAWEQLAHRMRDDEHVVVRGKRKSRAACRAMASKHTKDVLR